MSDVSSKKLLVISETPAVLQSFQGCFSSKGYELFGLSNAEGLPQLLRSHSMSAVVLDCDRNKHQSYWSWLKWLSNTQPSLPVITIIDNHRDPSERLGLLEQGASDYICKPFDPKELLIRCNKIVNGKHVCKASDSFHVQDIKVDTEKCLAIRHDREIELTQFETKILQKLYMHLGQTVSRNDIVLHVRGQQHHPSDRSIDIHINKIRKKIERDPTKPNYIVTTRGIGYRLQVESHYRLRTYS